MRLHLVFIGKTAFPDLDVAINRYLDRLKHYTSIEVHVLKAEKIVLKSSEEAVREREAERVLKLAGRSGHLLLWDQRGRETDSKGFSRFLEGLNKEAASDVWMVIGGALGFSAKLREQAASIFSLSKMTFPHDLARLIVLEQVYRAFTIIKGEPYHK